jgi:hypothetical protein
MGKYNRRIHVPAAVHMARQRQEAVNLEFWMKLRVNVRRQLRLRFVAILLCLGLKRGKGDVGMSRLKQPV